MPGAQGRGEIKQGRRTDELGTHGECYSCASWKEAAFEQDEKVYDDNSDYEDNY